MIKAETEHGQERRLGVAVHLWARGDTHLLDLLVAARDTFHHWEPENPDSTKAPSSMIEEDQRGKNKPGRHRSEQEKPPDQRFWLGGSASSEAT